MVHEDVDRMEAIMIDLLKVGATFYPPLALATPILTAIIKDYGMQLRTGLNAGTIVSDGMGGFVTKTWANDPRHQLNQDGTFKE
jgi:hypothetical protein